MRKHQKEEETMGMRRRWMVAAALGILIANISSVVTAGDNENVLKLKTGACTFTLLDSSGVKPLAKSQLLLTPVSEGAAIQMTADTHGKCAADVASGRYIMTVDGKHLAVLQTSEAAKVNACRVVVPEKSLLVGGAEEEVAANPQQDEAGRRGLAAFLSGEGGAKTVLVGTTVVVLGGAGGWLFYDQVIDDDDDDGAQEPASR